MAETRPGGVYKVSDRFVDANGAETKAPTRSETSEQRKVDKQAEQQVQEAARVAERQQAVAPVAKPKA